METLVTFSVCFLMSVPLAFDKIRPDWVMEEPGVLVIWVTTVALVSDTSCLAV